MAVLLGALTTLVASLMWVGVDGSWPRGIRRTMEGPSVARAIDSLDDAARAAGRFAARWDLTAGEVMEFSNGYYAELVDGDGRLATEVLVDRENGAVRLEFGPAMMWNTSYGMMPRAGVTDRAAVGPEDAISIADRWLDERKTGLHAVEPAGFPGYYTLHTVRDGQVVGMLSVNANTGAVWYHRWHGRFIRMAEPSDHG